MKNLENEAIKDNKYTYIDYLDRIKMIATSIFIWDGLDDICGTGAARFLENSLYEFGRACFLYDNNYGFIVLHVQPNDRYNIYGLPVKVMATSYAYNKEYDFDDIVYIMNNDLCKPTQTIVLPFAKRLYEIERTTDINLIAQKTPVLLEGDTKSILTLKNLYMNYSGNIPFVFGNKSFDIGNKINALKTDAPYLLDKLDLHKHTIFNELLTILGINNANTDKKERLITDEVESNNQVINHYLNAYYKTRKDAEEQINNMLENAGITDKVILKINPSVYEMIDNFDLSSERENIIDRIGGNNE